MRPFLLTACLLGGCDAAFDLVHVTTPDAGIDAPPDAPPDAYVDPLCPFGRLGGGLIEVCLTEMPQDQYVPPTILDTRQVANCTKLQVQKDANATVVCVIAAREILIANAVRVIGDQPLILVAQETLTVSGSVSVASRRGDPSGAGAGYQGCKTNMLNGTGGSSTLAGGGAAGGSFQTIGGNGGTADSASNAGGSAQQDTTSVTFVRGGCRGGNGGSASVLGSGGAGSGGGALYLIAGATLTVTATGSLDASGAAGGAGTRNTVGAGGGGGGGGSGGLLGLDAPKVVLEAGAKLVANGGGGGGGSSFGGSTESDATPGFSSVLTDTFPYPANGATQVATGGHGADVSRGASQGSGGGLDTGGGGGGGGAGFIRIFTTTLDDQGALITPAASN